MNRLTKNIRKIKCETELTKNLLPKIIKCKKLPQWIIESDRAAYHPASNTIYIRDDQSLFVLFHEFLHFFAHKLGFTFNNKIHKIIDKYLKPNKKDQ